MDLLHTRVQRPVGQGGFHTSTIQLPTASFRYIYDCGTTSGKSHLKKQVEFYCRELENSTATEKKGPVDAIFISHFDGDHVNGISELLTSVEVKTAVVPYLSLTERLLLLAKHHEPGLGLAAVYFLLDPIRRLGELGVGEVYSVRGKPSADADDIAPPAPPPPDAPPHAEVEKIALKPWPAPGTPRAFSFPIAGRKKSRGPAPNTKVFEIGHEGAFPIISDKGPLNWVLAPFVYHNHIAINIFKDFTDATFGRDVLEVELDRGCEPFWDYITKANRLKQLKAIYSSVAKSVGRGGGRAAAINGSSLCLYSGPIVEPKRAYVNMQPCGDCWYWAAHNVVGWLGTGDLPMAEPAVANSLRRHFSAYHHLVSTATVPHHGSILDYGNTPGRVSVISAGKNNPHGHPDPATIAAILARNQRPVVVTESLTDAFVEAITMHLYTAETSTLELAST